jgi:hypothetical protein
MRAGGDPIELAAHADDPFDLSHLTGILPEAHVVHPLTNNASRLETARSRPLETSYKHDGR